MAKKKKKKESMWSKISTPASEWGWHETGSTFSTSMDVNLRGGKRTPWYERKARNPRRRRK